MAASCFGVVRGKRVRVTRLDSCGAPPAATTANSLVTSSGFVSVAFAPDYEAGTEIIQKNANGDLCINDLSCDVFKRVRVTISFCNVDPDLYSLITGNSVEVDGAGNDVGYRVSEALACNQFALELWTGIDGQAACPPTNAVQSITEGGSGLTSFTLTVTVPGYSAATTSSIPASATAAQVQAALEGVDGIDPGDVTVTGPAGASNGPWQVQFTGRYAGLAIATMTSTPTGGTGTVTIAVVTAGGVATGGNYGYILLPFVRNGTLRDFTVELGTTNFEVQAWTDNGGNWGTGPYNVIAQGAGGVASALKTPIGLNDHMLVRTTSVAPPAAVCGYQAMPAAPTPAA
jgi:hypothetical protein